MKRTRKDQSIYDLADEYITAVKKLANEPLRTKLCQWYLTMEKENLSPEIIHKQITNLGGMNLSYYDLEFVKNINPRISPVLVAWIGAQTGANIVTLELRLMLISLVFWKDHDSEETLTLRWLVDQVGEGKIITYQELWPWYTCASDQDGTPVYRGITADELYRKEGKLCLD